MVSATNLVTKPRVILKEIVGVEDAVAKEVVDRSVKFIAAALGRNANERAGTAAIFRGIGICAHPKLLEIGSIERIHIQTLSLTTQATTSELQVEKILRLRLAMTISSLEQELSSR